MNLKTKLKNIKTRFKAASKAFLDPVATLKPTVFVKTLEPSAVLENQLLAGKNALITGAAKNIGHFQRCVVIVSGSEKLQSGILKRTGLTISEIPAPGNRSAE